MALVDSSDLPLVGGMQWHALVRPQTSYAGSTRVLASGRRQTVLMHRLLCGAEPGEMVERIERLVES